MAAMRHRESFAFASFAARLLMDAGAAVYLADDGRTIYRLDADGRRVDVGEIVETLPAGLVVEMTPTLASVAGAVVQK